MFKISKLADYAIVLLCQMVVEQTHSSAETRPRAGNEPHAIKAPTIKANALSEKTLIPLATVAKILKLLHQSEILGSKQGAQGGYFLNKNATEISIADILQAIEGPVALTSCIDSESDCNIISLCPLSDKWLKINHKIEAVLRDTSLAEMQMNDFTPAGQPAKRELTYGE